MSDNQVPGAPRPLPLAAAAKPDKPKPDKPKPDKHDKPKHAKHDKPEPKPLRVLSRYAGRVGAFGANADGVLDRFQLEAAEASHTVKFPPHFGQQVVALARPGQPVAVLGFPKPTPQGDAHLHLVRLDAEEASASPRPPHAAEAEELTLSGPVAEHLLDAKGHLRGLRLAGEATELRLPPHLSSELLPRLALGTAVAASGPRRALRPGEVLAHPEVPTPLRVELLTVADEVLLLP